MTLQCPGCARTLTDARCAYCGCAARAGNYTVDRVISQSAFSRVYRAVDPAGGVVALKELHFSAVPSTAQIDAFFREGQLLERISHPQVPRFRAAFQEGAGPSTRLYLAMEFVDGEPLSATAGKRQNEVLVRLVARQVLDVLTQLQAREPVVVHRDIKPANLIRAPGRAVMLVDFGSARPVATETHRSTFVGTFGYMPPEQLGGTVDVTTDVYALAATCLHLATGTEPAFDVVSGVVIPEQAQISPALRKWLRRCLERDRNRRFANAGAAAAALGDLREPREGMGRIVVGLAATLVLVLGTAGLAAYRLANRPVQAVQAVQPSPPPKVAPEPAPKPAPELVPVTDLAPSPIPDGWGVATWTESDAPRRTHPLTATAPLDELEELLKDPLNGRLISHYVAARDFKPSEYLVLGTIDYPEQRWSPQDKRFVHDRFPGMAPEHSRQLFLAVLDDAVPGRDAVDFFAPGYRTLSLAPRKPVKDKLPLAGAPGMRMAWLGHHLLTAATPEDLGSFRFVVRPTVERKENPYRHDELVVVPQLESPLNAEGLHTTTYHSRNPYLDRGLNRHVKLSDDGLTVTAVDVPPGRYRVNVRLQGFDEEVRFVDVASRERLSMPDIWARPAGPLKIRFKRVSPTRDANARVASLELTMHAIDARDSEPHVVRIATDAVPYFTGSNGWRVVKLGTGTLDNYLDDLYPQVRGQPDSVRVERGVVYASVAGDSGYFLFEVVE